MKKTTSSSGQMTRAFVCLETVQRRPEREDQLFVQVVVSAFVQLGLAPRRLLAWRPSMLVPRRSGGVARSCRCPPANCCDSITGAFAPAGSDVVVSMRCELVCSKTCFQVPTHTLTVSRPLTHVKQDVFVTSHLSFTSCYIFFL